MCGASDEQKGIFKDQQSFYHTMMDQAKTVFGSSSKIFNDIVSTFTPIMKAGPNQQGMSAGELAARRTYATETTAHQFRNASKAVGEKMASLGGGNDYVPSGAAIQTQGLINTAAAEEQANKLNDIEKENYAIGRENFWGAEKVLSGAPSVFNPATQIAGVANQSGNSASETADKITQANAGPFNAVMGAIGGIGGKVASAYL